MPLFTCSSLCRRDQLAILYFIQVVILLIPRSTTGRSGTTQRFVTVDLLFFNILDVTKTRNGEQSRENRKRKNGNKTSNSSPINNFIKFSVLFPFFIFCFRGLSLSLVYCNIHQSGICYILRCHLYFKGNINSIAKDQDQDHVEIITMAVQNDQEWKAPQRRGMGSFVSGNTPRAHRSDSFGDRYTDQEELFTPDKQNLEQLESKLTRMEDLLLKILVSLRDKDNVTMKDKPSDASTSYV